MVALTKSQNKESRLRTTAKNIEEIILLIHETVHTRARPTRKTKEREREKEKDKKNNYRKN